MPCVYRVRWRTAVSLLLLFIPFVDHLSSAGTHSLQYLYTALTPEKSFPNFTAVGLVDGEQFVYYDSNISKMIPKTEWMKKIKDDDPRYWESEKSRMTEEQDWLQGFENEAKYRFNNTEDHTIQWMYGCEYDDDGTTRGYDQYGYDGEDFFSLNMTTATWTADNDKAKSFINHWDLKGTKAEYWRNFLKYDCIDRLKKFVSHGNETQRKVRPKVSVFHKHSPSPEVVCHTTGFFPKALNITWQKDGEDVHENVELRETLPNQDGSFQKRSILKVSAAEEELQKHTYTCVVQHSSLEKELVREVPKVGGSGGGSDAGSDGGSGGGSDAGSDGGMIDSITLGVTVFGGLCALVAVVAGIVVWKKKNSAFKPVQNSDQAIPMKNLPPAALKV